MALNRKQLDEITRELERHGKLIGSALQALQDLASIYSSEREVQSLRRDPARQTRRARHAPQKKNKASESFCPKHPNDGQFSKLGQCKLCQSESMRAYWKQRKQQARRSSDHTRGDVSTIAVPVARSNGHESEDGPQYVYSRSKTCPKCGVPTRFRRLRHAAPNDDWVCLAGGCRLRIANYKIETDPDYQPSENIALPEFR